MCSLQERKAWMLPSILRKNDSLSRFLHLQGNLAPATRFRGHLGQCIVQPSMPCVPHTARSEADGRRYRARSAKKCPQTIECRAAAFVRCSSIRICMKNDAAVPQTPACCRGATEHTSVATLLGSAHVRSGGFPRCMCNRGCS